MNPAGDDDKEPFNLARLTIELKAIREGVRAAVEEHRKRRESVVIWKNGKVVELPPDEIPAPDEDAQPT